MAVRYEADFFVGRRVTVLASAHVVVPVIKDLLHPQSVLDVGGDLPVFQPV